MHGHETTANRRIVQAAARMLGLSRSTAFVIPELERGNYELPGHYFRRPIFPPISSGCVGTMHEDEDERAGFPSDPRANWVRCIPSGPRREGRFHCKCKGEEGPEAII